jgi:hypothetical protein
MTDEFEQRLQTDFVFNGSKQDVIDLWLTNRSNWYPATLLKVGSDGFLRCSVTGVRCHPLSVYPKFCRLNTMRYIACTSGECLYVFEACKRNEVPT